MSIESDIVAALTGVAGGRIYPLAAPEKAVKPFVIYKPQSMPIVAMDGAILGQQAMIVFEAWGESYASALSTANAIQPALVAAGIHGDMIDPPEDGYDPQVDEYVRPMAMIFMQ